MAGGRRPLGRRNREDVLDEQTGAGPPDRHGWAALPRAALLLPRPLLLGGGLLCDLLQPRPQGARQKRPPRRGALGPEQRKRGEDGVALAELADGRGVGGERAIATLAEDRADALRASPMLGARGGIPEKPLSSAERLTMRLRRSTIRSRMRSSLACTPSQLASTSSASCRMPSSVSMPRIFSSTNCHMRAASKRAHNAR